MVVLRLRRGGRTHSPHYRIVAQEKRSKLNGAYIESIGHYHPTNEKDAIVINSDRAKHWLSLGAKPSDTVVNLLVKEGVLPKTARIKRTKVKPVAAEEKTTPIEEKAVVAEEAEVQPEVAEVQSEEAAEPIKETESEK